MKPTRIVLLLGLAALIGLFFVFDLHRFLTVDYFATQRDVVAAYQAENPWTTAIGFLILYVLVTGISLPGAALLTVAAGALFGLVQGVVIVSFASSIGATVAFTIARYLFRDPVRSRFGRYLTSIDRGIEKDGAFYLFALRLVPAFPFFAINLAMSLTPLSTWTFYWVSQIGMLFRHGRLRERGRRTWPNRVRRRTPISGLVGLFRATRLGAADCQEDPRRHQVAAGTPEIQEAAALRQ